MKKKMTLFLFVLLGLITQGQNVAAQTAQTTYDPDDVAALKQFIIDHAEYDLSRYWSDDNTYEKPDLTDPDDGKWDIKTNKWHNHF